MRREISRDVPLFLVNFYYTDVTLNDDSIEALWSAVPDDLKENTVVLLIAERGLRNTPEIKDWITTWADRAQAASIPFAVQTINGETRTSQQIPVAWFRALAESHSMMHGVNAAELYNGEPWYGTAEGNHSDYVKDLILAASATGMHLIWTDTNVWGNGTPETGTIARWLEDNAGLYDAFRAHSANIVMMNKESFGDIDTDALNSGLWLAGSIGNWGTSSDWWHWGLNGYGLLGGTGGQDWKDILQYPDAMTVQSMLRVASQGGTAFKAEAQWFTSAIGGERTATYEYGIIPLLRDLKADLVHIPTREEMLAQNKAVFIDSSAWSSPNWDLSRSNLFPNSGRYGVIPLLPSTASDAEKAHFENVLSTPQDKTYFDALYPEQTIASDTFMSHTGNTWYWMNYAENQSYTATTTFKPADSGADLVGIEAGNHTFATFTEKDGAIDVSVNNYRVDKSNVRSETLYGVEPEDKFEQTDTYRYIHDYLTVKLDADGRPIVDADGNVTTAAGRTLNDRSDRDVRTTTFRVEGTWEGGKPALVFADPTDATRPYTVDEQWDADRKTLLVTLTHNGLVKFTIKTDGPPRNTVSTTREAEDPANELGSKLKVKSAAEASGGKVVRGGNGKGDDSTIAIAGLSAVADGEARLRVDAVAKKAGTVSLTVNGGPVQVLEFPGNRGKKPVSVTIPVSVVAGDNTIRFSMLTAAGPALDAIVLTQESAIPPVAPALALSAASVEQGESVVATVTGLPPVTQVSAKLMPGDIPVTGIPTADLTGAVSFNVPVDYVVPAGEHSIVVTAPGVDDMGAPLTVEAVPFIVTDYEAESAANTLSGAAAVKSLSAASSGAIVGELGAGGANSVTIERVVAQAAGEVRLRVSAVTGENRDFWVSVNEAAPVKLTIPGRSWTEPTTVETTVELAAGLNSIRFGNPSAYAPDLDAITVLEPTDGSTPAPALHLGAATVEQGTSVLAAVTGLDEGSQVSAKLMPGDIAVADIPAANGNGVVTFAVPVGSEVSPGEYTLVVTADGLEPLRAPFSVVAPTGITTYEAESAGNTLTGSAVVRSKSTASGGSVVGELGAGAGNAVTIEGVTARTSGPVTLRVAAVTGEDRDFWVSVNGATAVKLAVPGHSWDEPTIVEMTVDLAEGTNSISFGNPSAYAPDLDAVVVDTAA
ncbi:glycoside hydrolase family 98 domain-containing protein [Agromyces sp. NPDC056965]|uniref:glycoside hydrolase family 98 domain-containing protein n=1 Tax=Agromyces sp. NPDC056965 TaxID=3345983 RepID=UPI003628B952